MGDEMPRYNFGGVLFEQIYSWMQGGAGMEGVESAAVAQQALADQLRVSQERLRAGLEALGVGWKGTAADGGQAASWMVHDWGVEAAPVISKSADKTLEFGAQAEANRSRMPTLAELEPSELERLAGQFPVIGPGIDQRARDERRQRVTQEARDRMREWQDTAHSIVRSVPVLPGVPKPVVKAKPPETLRPVEVGEPGQTRSVGVGPGVPAPPGTPGAPSTPPGVPGPGPASPSLPGPVPGPPGGQAPPVRPVVPPPPVGVGGGQEAGRRGRWGPGVFGREEIARSRGTGTGMGQPGRGLAGNAAGNAARPAGTSAGAGGRGGSGIMQPAVGRGAGKGDEDSEHKDKYADKTDEHFTEGIKKVAPPVIGG